MLRDAQREDRARLEQLLAAYLFEFDGRPDPYPHLGAYWEEPERLPFLIEADSEVVGLCLVRQRDKGWSIAEFSVVPDRRRGGVGRAAVDVLAARAHAEGAAYLEAKVHPNNREALPFWLSVGFRRSGRINEHRRCRHAPVSLERPLRAAALGCASVQE
jgi:ribosomal protein S18 acetylase RimI-like enzyme